MKHLKPFNEATTSDALKKFFHDKIDWKLLQMISDRLTFLCDTGGGYTVDVEVKISNNPKNKAFYTIYTKQEGGSNDVIEPMDYYEVDFTKYIKQFKDYYATNGGIYYTLRIWDNEGRPCDKQMRERVRKSLEYFCIFRGSGNGNLKPRKRKFKKST